MSNIIAVCVVDAHPRFYCEAALWLACVQRNTTFLPALVFVNGAPANLAAWAKRRGALVENASTLYHESPHCNKIIPYEVFGDENIIVTDCDVFVLRDFKFMLSTDRVRLPQNNHNNPPFVKFVEMLMAAGFEPPFEPGISLFRGRGASRETFSRNVSCGVIWVPEQLREVIAAWKSWVEWLIRNREAMGGYRIHVDQVAIAMALHELGTPFEHLPAQTNAVLHLLPEIETCYALHLTSGHIPKFDSWFEPNGCLKTSAFNRALAKDLAEFNASVLEVLPLLESWDETKGFSKNFLNPNWLRS
jgi:hypothetical protein